MEDRTLVKASRREGLGTCKGQKGQCGEHSRGPQVQAGVAGEGLGVKARMCSLS